MATFFLSIIFRFYQHYLDISTLLMYHIRVLSTGGGGGGRGKLPPKNVNLSPKHFHKVWQTLLSNSHTLAINFLSAINKVQSSKLCHRLSINRSC